MIKKWNKRGITNEMLILMADLIVIAIFITSLFSFVMGVVKNTIFERNYLTRDIALMTDSAEASPHLLNYKYQENITNFKIEIKNNEVKVSDIDNDEAYPNSYWYACDIKQEFKYGPEENDQMFFIKNKGFVIHGK